MSLVLNFGTRSKAIIEENIANLVASKIASRISTKDATIWGQAAEAEAAIRLNWVSSAADAQTLIENISQLREQLVSRGLSRVILSGMGGSSLAPEVIAKTNKLPLTILDTTHPVAVARITKSDLSDAIIVVSSKSGSTVETASHLASLEAELVAQNLEPANHIVVVTDPNSALHQKAENLNYHYFLADPNVGGRYSALTAFGLVPTGLAGFDIANLVAEALEVTTALAEDSESNLALQLGCAIAGDPQVTKLLLLNTGNQILGFSDWVEQLIAESTGKENSGVLPIAVPTDAPELWNSSADVLKINFTMIRRLVLDDEIFVAGKLGAQFLLWEYATAIAGFLQGINPFDQPDVESAKIAARAVLSGSVTTERTSPEASIADANITEIIEAFLGELDASSYIALQLYLDPVTSAPEAELLRNRLATASGRPVSLGYGPRFLHSTGQYHKGGHNQGHFIQIIDENSPDYAISNSEFSYGELIAAQAKGDSAVLSDRGASVLTIKIKNEAELANLVVGVSPAA